MVINTQENIMNQLIIEKTYFYCELGYDEQSRAYDDIVAYDPLLDSETVESLRDELQNDFDSVFNLDGSAHHPETSEQNKAHLAAYEVNLLNASREKS